MILALPHIPGSQPARIEDFYRKLLSNVQALETLGKLREISGYVQMTIDKLVGIRGDLVRTNDDWQEWDFPQLVLALRKWTTLPAHTTLFPVVYRSELETPNFFENYHGVLEKAWLKTDSIFVLGDLNCCMLEARNNPGSTLITSKTKNLAEAF